MATTDHTERTSDAQETPAGRHGGRCERVGDGRTLCVVYEEVLDEAL
jgi:hypothetical protein